MIKAILIGAIKAYQRAGSLFIPRSCRFHPSCSHYAIEAFEKHGAIKGIGKAMWRILRCSPLSQGGYDPIR